MRAKWVKGTKVHFAGTQMTINPLSFPFLIFLPSLNPQSVFNINSVSFFGGEDGGSAGGEGSSSKSVQGAEGPLPAIPNQLASVIAPFSGLTLQSCLNPEMLEATRGYMQQYWGSGVCRLEHAKENWLQVTLGQMTRMRSGILNSCCSAILTLQNTPNLC